MLNMLRSLFRLSRCHAERSAAERGAAGIEMALVLPLMLLFFIGLMATGEWIKVDRMLTTTTNATAEMANALRVADLGDTRVLWQVLREAQDLASPYPPPKINVRYCRWKNGGLEQFFQGESGDLANSCVADNGCINNQTTASGHGAFIQVSACTRYNPIVPLSFLGPNYAGANGGTEGVAVQATSYLSLVDANQEQLIENYSGISVPCGTNCPTPQPDPQPPGPNPGPVVPPTNGCTTSCTGPGETQAPDCSCKTSCTKTCTGNTELDTAACICKPKNCTNPNYAVDGNGNCSDTCFQPPGKSTQEIQQCFQQRCPPSQGLSPDGAGGCKTACTVPGEEWNSTLGKCAAPCPSGQINPGSGCVNRCGSSEAWNEASQSCIENDCRSKGMYSYYGKCVPDCPSGTNPGTSQMGNPTCQGTATGGGG